MNVRRALVTDIPRMVDLMRELAAFEKMKGPDADAARRLVQDFGRRYDAFVVEAEGGEVVAYAIYYETYSNFLAKPVVWLEDLFVAPRARRGGVATRLMEAVRAEGVARGCGRMAWAVLDWNAEAITFYEKLGAKKQDWLWYQLDLDP